MLVAIDIGNSNIVFGIYNKNKLLDTFRLNTNESYTIDELGFLISKYFTDYNINYIEAVVIASVVPALTEILKKSIEKYFNIKPYIIGEDININIRNLYKNPKQTGVDRLINAAWAIKKYGANLIIIDMGTATTIDVVNSECEFVGGVIFPGINILKESLATKTAILPNVPISKPCNIIGKNTQECIQSGLYYGCLCAIDGILLNMKQEMNSDLKVIATGGLAKYFLKNNPNINYFDETLTLDGIKFIYESKCSSNERT